MKISENLDNQSGSLHVRKPLEKRVILQNISTNCVQWEAENANFTLGKLFSACETLVRLENAHWYFRITAIQKTLKPYLKHLLRSKKISHSKTINSIL